VKGAAWRASTRDKVRASLASLRPRFADQLVVLPNHVDYSGAGIADRVHGLEALIEYLLDALNGEHGVGCKLRPRVRELVVRAAGLTAEVAAVGPAGCGSTPPGRLG
jgi:hypothetical protein